MGLNANNSQNGGSVDYPIMAPGGYPTRLVGVIDLGQQAQRPYKGEAKAPVYKIALTYEFVDEFMLDEDGQEDKSKPRWLTEMMPLYSLSSDRAKSTIRYNAIDPGGEAGGDFAALLGVPVTVTVVHNPGEKRTYENIEAVSPMRAKDQATCPALVNQAFSFDLDAPTLETWEQVPKWIQKIIRENLNFAGSPLALLLGDEGPAKAPGAETTASLKEEAAGSEVPDEEVPF